MGNRPARKIGNHRPAPWKAGPRLHPAIRTALKLNAATAHVTLERYLHRLLCRELVRADLADATPPPAIVGPRGKRQTA